MIYDNLNHNKIMWISLNYFIDYNTYLPG